MLVLRGYACWVAEGLGVKVAEQRIAEPDLGGVPVEGAESDAPATDGGGDLDVCSPDADEPVGTDFARGHGPVIQVLGRALVAALRIAVTSDVSESLCLGSVGFCCFSLSYWRHNASRVCCCSSVRVNWLPRSDQGPPARSAPARRGDLRPSSSACPAICMR